jgi:hypothetical protein
LRFAQKYAYNTCLSKFWPVWQDVKMPGIAERQIAGVPAAFGTPSRTPHQIFRGLRASHVHPASVTDGESIALKKHCTKIVKKLKAKISKERARGRHRIVRRYQTELWEGLAARLVAAWEGNRKIRARQRKRHELTLPSGSGRQACRRLGSQTYRLCASRSPLLGISGDAGQGRMAA